MDFDNEVKNALIELTKDGTFKIEQIVYDEKNFGNVIVEISSYKNLNIRFIKDKGYIWCELSKFQEWFNADDVFAVLGFQTQQIAKDMIDAISNISAQINGNLISIFEAFDEKNIKETKKKIEKVATKRSMGLL